MILKKEQMIRGGGVYNNGIQANIHMNTHPDNQTCSSHETKHLCQKVEETKIQTISQTIREINLLHPH